MTVQIYNIKKRLSRVSVKYFYIIFSANIKLFNIQAINRFIFLKNNRYICAIIDKSSTKLIKHTIWQTIRFSSVWMV